MADCQRYTPRALIAVLILLTAVSSCVKEEFDADLLDPTLQINPGLAAPIGWARYQLDEILLDSLNPDEMYIDGNGFISMVYHQDLYSFQASEIIDIPDTEQEIELPNPFGVPVDLGTLTEDTVFRADTFMFSLDVGGTSDAEIDSIRLRWGLITFEPESDYPGLLWHADLNICGTEWNATLRDDDPPETDTLENMTIPLFNTLSGNNQLCIKVVLRIDHQSTGMIGDGTIITLRFGLSEMDYSAIYGYLGQFPVNAGPETFSVDFYNRLSGGTFYFKDPQLKIGFQNSFGLPIGISMENFEATGRQGQITSVEGDSVPGSGDPRVIAYPDRSQEGLSIADSIVLDRDNSNLFDAVLATSPESFTLEVLGSTNPGGVNHENFLLDSSHLTVSADLILPLEGYADFLIMADTLDFIFGEYFDNPPEEIKRLIFRLNYLNQFPVDVISQLYFLDENYQVLDSLFHEKDDERRIVKGASDENGNDRIDEPEEIRTEAVEIELTREQIDNIAECHYVLGKGEVSTTGYDSGIPEEEIPKPRFYSYYYFHTYIGVIAELEMNSDDY